MEEPHEPAPSSPLKRKRSETLERESTKKKTPTKKPSFSLSRGMKRARSNLALFGKDKVDESQNRVFGRELAEVMDNQVKDNPFETLIPTFVVQSFRFLRKHGMQVQGIFRQSGSLEKVKEFVKLVNEGIDPCKDLQEHDVHTVSCAVKQFLRDLPTPLLTHDLCSKFLEAAESKDADGTVVEQIDTILAELPTYNALLLDSLLELLTEISASSEHNSMTASNLATVIGPALLWSQTQATDGALEQLQSITQIIRITSIMIENYDKLTSLALVRENEKKRQLEAQEKQQSAEESSPNGRTGVDLSVLKTLRRTPLSKIAKAIRDEQIRSIVSPTIQRAKAFELLQQSPILIQQYEQENIKSPRATTPSKEKERSKTFSARLRIKPKVFTDVRNLFDYSQNTTQKDEAGPTSQS